MRYFATIFISSACVLYFKTVIALSPNEPHHLGCYLTSFVDSYNYYKFNYSLPWQECVQVCNERFTRYVGVKVDRRERYYNHFFCGNDLIEHSTSVQNSRCRPCHDNITRYCGGHNTMSVYQIRETTPLAILLATDRGVKMFNVENLTSKTRTSYTDRVHAVDFLFESDEIYFLSKEKLLRSSYNFLSLKYDLPAILIDYSYILLGLAVDWTKQNIYWSYWYNNVLYMKTLITGHIKEIFDKNKNMQHLAFDPYYRILYYLEENKLLSYSSEKGTTVISGGSMHFKNILNMTLDTHGEMIYVIGAVDQNNELFLGSIDYNNQNVRVLFNGPQLSDPFGLDVFNGDVVWGNREQNMSVLYKCKLSPRCHPENITVLHQWKEPIYDFKIYHPEKQTPSTNYLCRNITCPYLCTRDTLFTAKCACPEGMVVGPDGMSCQDAPSTFTVKSMETTKPPSIISTSSHVMEEMITDKTALTKTNLINENQQSSNKESSQINANANRSSTKYLFPFFICISMVMLIVLALIIIFLQLKSYRSNQTRDRTTNETAEEERKNVFFEVSDFPSKIGSKCNNIL